MKVEAMKVILISILFLTLQAHAQPEVAPDKYIDLLPLQLQNRYEDSANQERTNRQYQAYTLAVQYSIFRPEIEFNQFYDKTNVGALTIEKTIRELDLDLGIRVFQLISDDRRLTLNAFAKVLIGQTETTNVTTMPGQKDTDKSDKDLVLGAGASVMARLAYFIMEAEFRTLNSKNMSPQTVPVLGLKIGASIPY